MDGCSCPERVDNNDHPKHVADQLITELGLRQEWTWAWPHANKADSETGYGFIVDSREEAEAGADKDGRFHVVTRYITEWSRE
jgi:hypothetical protein